MLLGLEILVSAETVERIDPARGQRVDHSCGYAMDRALAVRGVRPVMARAASRHTPGSVTLNDPLGSLDPWQSWLDLRPDLRPCLKQLDGPLRTLAQLHFGLDGRRPLAVTDLAEQFQMTSTAVVRSIRKAQRQLRRGVRGGH